ncbi:hypothetical protein [Actinophytocola sp.]|jgi:hypothetical protein|uniref:hypothetical protein n=1 Tax=Actinophytocola sp. TaxID=1872138 RepID=UPI002EDA8E04
MSAPDLDDEELEDSGPAGAQLGGIGELRADHVIAITDSQGPVTIADRVEFYIQSGTRGTESAFGAADTSRTPRLVPADILTDLARVFVVPPGYGDIVRQLRDPGTVVLSGLAGSGRHSAALMALGASGQGTTRFRELPDDGGEGEYVLDAGAIETGERLLLDLSAEAGPLRQRVVSDLRAYRAVVAERQAYLAVVLPPRLRDVADDLGTAMVEIGRPDGKRVFRRHLDALGVPVPDGDLKDETLTGHLDHDPMRQIAALAGRVRRARNAAEGRSEWRDWLGVAMHPDAQLDAVARFVRENPDGRVRALLLAAATFEHATPDTVADAMRRLLDVVGYPHPEEHRLDRPDLAEALREIDATIDDRRVRFDTITYAPAVRTHFWGTFPDLRDELGRWIDRCVSQRALPAVDRVEVVLRYTDQCLLTGHPDDLCALAERWGRRSPATVDHLLDSMGPALTRGLLDERYGPWFRRRVYTWSYNRQLPPSLATLLIGLCDGVIAPLRPQQALVRLRHFTHHSNQEVAGEARATLARLATDGHFARRMLTRVHADLVGERPHPVDYDLFTDVADPVRLTASGTGAYPRIAEPETRELLTECWTGWLENQPYGRFAVAVRPWLDAHVADPRRALLLDALAAATRGHPRLLAVLYAAARDWVTLAPTLPDQRSRQRTAALLQHKCRTATLPAERRPDEGDTD